MDPLELAALELVNHVRHDLGMPPIKRLNRGIPCDTGNCPIARSIKGRNKELAISVYDDVALLPEDGTKAREWKMSTGALAFRVYFDDYNPRFQHLVLRGVKVANPSGLD
jgi:hypothetical protein